MTLTTQRAKRQPVEGTKAKAPDGSLCEYIQVECGLTPGDSLSIGRYPDGDYVVATVVHTKAGPATVSVVLAPETMKDVVQALFQLVQQ